MGPESWPREQHYIAHIRARMGGSLRKSAEMSELLNGKTFDTLLEARVLTERWRRDYNKY